MTGASNQPRGMAERVRKTQIIKDTVPQKIDPWRPPPQEEASWGGEAGLRSLPIGKLYSSLSGVHLPPAQLLLEAGSIRRAWPASHDPLPGLEGGSLGRDL